MNILNRVSVRRYTGSPVTDEEITAILHAAMSAPSAVNRQPWEFFVVDDPEFLTRLADALPYAKMAAQAPLAIVVCGNKERFLEGVDDVLWEQDLSAASENILLAAHAIGLGGVDLSLPARRAYRSGPRHPEHSRPSDSLQPHPRRPS